MKRPLLLSALLSSMIFAQDLKTTLQEVIQTNPDIIERAKNYNVTKEDITVVKSGYYPKLNLSLGIGKEKNDQYDRPGLADANTNFSVYENSISLTQNIFDGFSTTYQLQEQKARTISAAYSYIEKVNSVSFSTVSAYLELMRNKELLQTSKENVKITDEIFKKVQKLYDSGLTTLSEVNKIQSSLSLAKANYVVQKNSLMDAKFVLQRFLGRYLDPDKMQKPELDVALPASMEDAAQKAIQNNPSILVAKYNIKLAQATYKEKKAPYYPSVDLEVSQSMNKNLSGIEGHNDTFRAMAYVTYNFFNGFADQANLQKSISQIHQEVQNKSSLRRQVIQNLNQAWTSYKNLKEQLEDLKEYKTYSLKTLTLYSKEYDLGRRSLLDLLSAQNDFIGSKSQIINNEYNLLLAKARILDAMGGLVNAVLTNSDVNYYGSVGLHGAKAENNDTVLISYDRDNDLIVDDSDLCDNSLSKEMKDIYGCSFKDTNISVIERYSPFTFEDDSAELTNSGSKRLNALVKQLSPYGLKKIKLTIIGNTDSDDLSQKEISKLSEKRAKSIAALFEKEGVLKENIQLLSKGNEAPLVSDETSQGKEMNNRVDIIVKKLK
ncbi:TolC family outer membrane protein [Sulfurimonas sp. HSL-1716]|uniref:TolC family outer membrane protein n=1 Tax=Hydrocurvibacter sulfurireducens TaxID=3131937 RepID=UPI0031F8426A